MTKKTPYFAYYYSANPEATPGQLKTGEYALDYDISAVSDRMDKLQICGMVNSDPDFHRKLSHIPSPPKVLYWQGDISLLHRPILGVVGPRQMSPYAEKVLDQLFALSPSYDIVTISGLAPGVDTYCHELSLKYNIPTIAVLGWGFDHFLRSTKRDLISRIVEGGGLILSQYKHSFRPTDWSFPDRNRIIAGLADAVFLPEATEKSGSLITADIAHQIGRPIGAPMNHVFSESSKGTNKAISEWRMLALADISSFLEKYFTRTEESLVASSPTSIEKIPELTDDEKIIYTLLRSSQQPVSVAELTAATHRSMSQLLTVLTLMEMNNYIREFSPWTYSLL